MLAGLMYLRTVLHCCLFAGAALAILRQTYQGIADRVVRLRLLHTVPSLVPRLTGGSDREMYYKLTSFFSLTYLIKSQYLLKGSRIS